MSLLNIVIFLILGIILFVGSIAMRSKTESKYEIKGIDLALILVPFVVWLFLTGRVERIAIGGVELDVAEAFTEASSAPIYSQVTRTTTLPIESLIENVESNSKGGVDQIPRLIEQKTEALEFRLQHGGYWGPAIQTYFESLSAYTYLRYAIIHREDGTLLCVYDARDLLGYFRQEGDGAYRTFARNLNEGDEPSVEQLKSLPGYIPGRYGVTSDQNKRFVLQKMDEWDADVIPVVDANNRFIGMVERARVTASLILDVSENLEKLNR